MTLSTNTPVVLDLRANATAASDRLQLIGQKVGMAAHSKAASFFSMAQELSNFLRFIESGAVSRAAVLVAAVSPGGADRRRGQSPIGNDTRRVITEWAAATGKDLKLSREAPSSPGQAAGGCARQPAARRRLKRQLTM